jgi:superfamily II DNA or RNA helicase
VTEVQLNSDPRFTTYQSAFFHRFVAELGAGSVHLLVAPPGTGKSFTIAATISELVGAGRLRRTLVLSPAALVAQWADSFRERGRDLSVLDGRAFRLLRERTGHAVRDWPEGVYAMSIDLAKRPDVQDLLVGVPWNLVAIDEAHSLVGERRRLIERMASRPLPPAILLSTATPIVLAESFASGARLIDWTEAVKSYFANENAALQVAREVRTYRRSGEEIAVAEIVLTAVRQIEQQKAMILLQRAASSVRSVEDTLVRWLESGEATPDRLTLEPILIAVEQLRRDSKLDCLVNLARELLGKRRKHIVVFAEYVSTMEYVAAAVEGLGADVYQLFGNLPDEQRYELFTTFANQGGILVTTSASQAFSLSFVQAAVHYDLPFSATAFVEREASYQRYGRLVSCTVYFLRDEAEALPAEELVLRTLLNLSVPGADLREDIKSVVSELVQLSAAHSQ